jgi:hypothetical protein
MPIQMRQLRKRMRRIIPTLVTKKVPVAVKAKMRGDVNNVMLPFLSYSASYVVFLVRAIRRS